MSYQQSDFDAVEAVLRPKGCANCTSSICEAFRAAGYPPAEWATTLHAMDAPTFQELIRAIETEMAESPSAPAPAPEVPRSGWDLLDLGPLVPSAYDVTPPPENSLLELHARVSNEDLASLASAPPAGHPAQMVGGGGDQGVDLLGLCLHTPPTAATALPLTMEVASASEYECPPPVVGLPGDGNVSEVEVPPLMMGTAAPGVGVSSGDCGSSSVAAPVGEAATTATTTLAAPPGATEQVFTLVCFPSELVGHKIRRVFVKAEGGTIEGLRRSLRERLELEDDEFTIAVDDGRPEGTCVRARRVMTTMCVPVSLRALGCLRA
eukprot:COSAG05_NODE_373_length_10684_cov_22.075012_4_plen_322_part_00